MNGYKMSMITKSGHKDYYGESSNGQTFSKSTERFSSLYGSLSSSSNSGPPQVNLSVCLLHIPHMCSQCVGTHQQS